jgi:hypothetical protein
METQELEVSSEAANRSIVGCQAPISWRCHSGPFFASFFSEAMTLAERSSAGDEKAFGGWA